MISATVPPRRRRMALILVVALAGMLALNGSVLAQDGPVRLGGAQAPLRDPPRQYAVRAAAAAGGGYRLSGGGWQVWGAASGPGYRLEAVGAPAGAGPEQARNFGTPCCCVSLPCVLR
jgi:hypothetical protein